jgi:type VI secretion system protein ImpG
MALNPFYEDELSYLRDMGREFARANPRLVTFLGQEAKDPDVERLLEAFAFLVARLRQRLEDEMPELVHGMLRLIWPHYLRPVPPMTVIEFNATGSAATDTRIEAGTKVLSRMIEDTQCEFRTCYPTTILPLSVRGVEFENRSTSAKMTVRLSALSRGGMVALAGNRLRFFFNTEREPHVGRALLTWLLRHVRQIRVSTGEGSREFTLGQEAIHPLGFGDEDGVIPYPPRSYVGFRLLQEYLTFPAKFLFVELSGLDRLSTSTSDQLVITFDFNRPFPDQVRVNETHLRLNCTPAINLFQADAFPIRMDRSKTEYLIRPEKGPTQSIYEIRDITGFLAGGAGRIAFEPFETINHDILPDAQDRHYYRERLRPALIGRGVDRFVTFVNASDKLADLNVEMATVRLICTNGPIVDRLAVGMIDQPTADVPPGVSLSNLIPVSGEVSSPIGDKILWRLVSNLSRNFGSLVDVGTLKGMIASYDFRAIYDAQAKRRLDLLLEGLERFEHSSGDTLVRGVPTRLREIKLIAAESKIGGEGELFLLGSVLDAFLTSYAGINTLHRFTVQGSETNLIYRWKPRAGVGQPI